MIVYPVQIHTMQTADINYFSDNIYFYGCDKECSFCFNKELWVVPNDAPYLSIDEIIKKLSPYTKWVALMGGEPMLYNILPLIKRLHNYGKKVILFTSHADIHESLLENLDYIHIDIKLDTNEEYKNYKKDYRKKISYGIVDSHFVSSLFYTRTLNINRSDSIIYLKHDIYNKKLTGVDKWLNKIWKGTVLISEHLIL